MKLVWPNYFKKAITKKRRGFSFVNFLQCGNSADKLFISSNLLANLQLSCDTRIKDSVETFLHPYASDSKYLSMHNSLMHSIYKFSEMVLVTNLHWRYLSIYLFPRYLSEILADMQLLTLLEMSTPTQTIKINFEHDNFLKGQCTIFRPEYVFRKSHMTKLIKPLTDLIYERVHPM